MDEQTLALLRQLAGVDVLRLAIPAHNRIRPISAGESAGSHPAIRALSKADAMLDVIRLPGGDRSGPCLDHARQVLGMDNPHPAPAQSLAPCQSGQVQPALAKVEEGALRVSRPGHLWVQLHDVSIVVLAITRLVLYMFS